MSNTAAPQQMLADMVAEILEDVLRGANDVIVDKRGMTRVLDYVIRYKANVDGSVPRSMLLSSDRYSFYACASCFDIIRVRHDVYMPIKPNFFCTACQLMRNQGYLAYARAVAMRVIALEDYTVRQHAERITI